LLEWVTADEQRFSHIEVERSADGASFKMLDRITAHLGNEPEKQYHYNDGALLSGRAYYRLKLVDLDGRATYSDIRQIMLKDNHHWTVYPNPASTKIAVELPADWSQGSTDWSIVDMAGRKITTGVSKAGNLLHIPVIAIPEGRYTLVLQHRESGFRKALPLQVDR
jgi:hypothetical protein